MMQTGREVYRTYDEIGVIQVIEDAGKRYLAFGTEDEQSCQLIQQPHILQLEYTRAIMLSLLMVNPKNITLIGLGGGSLALTFHTVLPKTYIQAIELRDMVVKTAQKYFHLPKSDNIQYTSMEGFDYLKAIPSHSTQLIVADMYTEQGVDQQQLSQAFIQQCERNLSPNGWLVLNCWLDHKLNSAFIQALDESFSLLYACDTGGGNWVLFAGKVDINHFKLCDTSIKIWSKKLGFSLTKYLNRLVTITHSA